MKVSISSSDEITDEVADTIASALKGVEKGLLQDSFIQKSCDKVGIEGLMEMIRPVIKADLTVAETEAVFDTLIQLIKRAKVRSVFPADPKIIDKKTGGGESDA